MWGQGWHLQRKKSWLAYSWQIGIGAHFLPSEKESSLGVVGVWSGWLVSAFGLRVLARLPGKCQGGGDLSAANSCLLRIGLGPGASAQLSVGKAKPELLFPSLLNLQ